MNEGTGSVTQVRIFNQTYDVRSNDPVYVRELAGLLDERMNEIAKLTPTVDTLKVAILAALNLADECLAGRLQLESLEADVRGPVDRMIERLSSLPQESD